MRNDIPFVLAIFRALFELGPMTTEKVAESIHISVVDASRLLRLMQDSGFVEVVNLDSSNGSVWRVVHGNRSII